jgi:hypothetical protein
MLLDITRLSLTGLAATVALVCGAQAQQSITQTRYSLTLSTLRAVVWPRGRTSRVCRQARCIPFLARAAR